MNAYATPSFIFGRLPWLMRRPSSGHTFLMGILSLVIRRLAKNSSRRARSIMTTLISIIGPMASSGVPMSFRYPMYVGPVKNSACFPIMVSAMYVPPVSERDLAKQRMNPVASPARKSGRVMVRTAVHFAAPRVMAAVS